MVRNVLGSVLALIGAAAAVWSPFRAWYDGRHGRDIRIEDLFQGIGGEKAELFGSVLLPMLFAALVALFGILLRSRLLVFVAGAVVLGFTILWMVRQGQAAGSLTVGENADQGLGIGVASALGGGAVLWLAALVMSGRRGVRARRRDADFDDRYGEPQPYAAPGPEWEPGPIRAGDTPPQGVPAHGAPPPPTPPTPHHQPPVRWPGAGHPPPEAGQQSADDQPTRAVRMPPASDDPGQPPRPGDPDRPHDGTRPFGKPDTARPDDETRPIGRTGPPRPDDETRPIGRTGPPRTDDETRPIRRDDI
ncbi:hypothetical protein ACH4FX_01425 [Streptomyces sp. NPDC018019]|uniref:hypothetical protein n=1 Tax=Streptomyces sp. NPDC018019 TaxID=3365030 RepID=UPI00379277AB